MINPLEAYAQSYESMGYETKVCARTVAADIRQNMMKHAEPRGLTENETLVVLQLGKVWNMFLELPEEHADDVAEFRAMIHRAQEKVLCRPGRRELNK